MLSSNIKSILLFYYMLGCGQADFPKTIGEKKHQDFTGVMMIRKDKKAQPLIRLLDSIPIPKYKHRQNISSTSCSLRHNKVLGSGERIMPISLYRCPHTCQAMFQIVYSADPKTNCRKSLTTPGRDLYTGDILYRNIESETVKLSKQNSFFLSTIFIKRKRSNRLHSAAQENNTAHKNRESPSVSERDGPGGTLGSKMVSNLPTLFMLSSRSIFIKKRVRRERKYESKKRIESCC